MSRLFALICRDKPGALETRMQTRPAHLDYLNGLKEKGVLKLGGPFLDENDKPCGSMLIVAAEDKAGAERIAEGDPYAKAGLFEAVDIKPFNWTVNNPEE